MILVVDDEETLRESVVDYLKISEFQTLQAGSAQEALSIYNPEQVKLVLSDIRMPGMDGIALFRELRKINPNVKVIFMTGYCSDEQQKQIKQYNLTCLIKPFIGEDIDEAIQKELSTN